MDTSTEVLTRVSETTGTDITELPPLQSFVDVDSLNKLADSVSLLELEYAGVTVEIQRGDVMIRD